MTRTTVFLLTGCLMGLVAYASNAWTQERRSDGAKTEAESAPLRAAGASNAPLTPRNDFNNVLSQSGFVRGHGQNMRPKTVSRTVNGKIFTEVILEPIPPEELEELEAFQKAKQALKDAKDELEKQTAIDSIQQHLDKQFERDVAQRERDLSAIEERVKSLRQQLSKRQVAKKEIIALRLKTIVNRAEGLDFPGDDDPLERPLGAGFGQYPPVGQSLFQGGGLPGRAGGSPPAASSGLQAK